MSFTLIMLCEAADQEDANALAVAADPEGGAGTFSTGLSSDGSMPPTYYGANHGGATDDWVDTFKADAGLQSPTCPSLQWWKVSNSTGKLLEKSDTATVGVVGEAWNVWLFMAATGLQFAYDGGV